MENKLLLKSRRDPKPLFLKLGFALALSIAGFVASRIRSRPPLPPPPGKNGAKSPKIRAGGIRDELRVLSSEEELANIVNGRSSAASAASKMIDELKSLSSEEEMAKIVNGTSKSTTKHKEEKSNIVNGTSKINSNGKVIGKVIDEMWLLSSDEELMKIINGTSRKTTKSEVIDEPRVPYSEEETTKRVNEASNIEVVNDNEFETYQQSKPMKAMNMKHAPVEEDLVETVKDISNSNDIALLTSDELRKEKLELEQETSYLRNLVEALKERERKLELQMVEYHGLKEKLSNMRELENRVKINATESKLLYIKIDSLQSKNQKLQAQVADYPRAVADLEAAREEIKVLKGRLMLEGEEAKEKLDILNQRVTKLQDQILKGGEIKNADSEKKTRVTELENNVMDLQKVNSRLVEENLKLAQLLDSTNMTASSSLQEKEAENNRLKEENDTLKTEIEQLQTDRCADVEELVYLRWVNACLRYELRNYQPPPGKTVAKDLGRTMSPESEQKAKQLILEYANSGFNDKNLNMFEFDTESYSSSRDSSEEHTETSTDISSKKSKFFTKLRKLVLGKDGSRSKDNAFIEETYGVRRSSFDSMSSCISVDSSPAETKKNPRLSLDIERKLDVRSERCKSDIGSSQSHMRVISEDNILSGLFRDQDHDEDDVPEKAKLKKFANVFRRSQKPPKRRLASFS